MTTATTTQVPSVLEPHDCGSCGETFTSLIEVFEHDCAAENLARRAGIYTGAQGVSIDPPVRHGAGQGRPTASEVKTNRYPGTCPECGTQVPAGAGHLIKVAGKFGARHVPGACPQPVAPVEEVVAKATPRANRYAGPCGNCGRKVAAGAGTLERTETGWTVWHAEGECPRAEFVATDGTIVPEGFYAYRVDDVVKFFGLVNGAVHAQASADLHPINGGGQHVIDRIAELGAFECAGLYGQELGKCGRCRRVLTDELSRQIGIGPICRGKGW